MKDVKIKLVGLNKKTRPQVSIDGNILQFKKNEFDSYECQFQTDNNEIELVVTRELELKYKFWWLFAVISFIVSIFGIFEPFYDRKSIAIDARFKVKLDSQNSIILKFNPLSTQGKAVTLEGANEPGEIENRFYIDKIAKKRWILLLILKILVWIGLGCLIAFLIAKYL